MNHCKCRGRLGVFALAMAVGIANGFSILLLGLMGHFFHSGLSIITLASSIYIGFEPSIMGAIIGGLWAFLEGAIWAAIVATLYNTCLCCAVCKCKTCDECTKKSVE